MWKIRDYYSVSRLNFWWLSNINLALQTNLLLKYLWQENINVILYNLNDFQTLFFKFFLDQLDIKNIFILKQKAVNSNFFTNQKLMNWAHMETNAKLLRSEYVSLCLGCTDTYSSCFSDYQSDNLFFTFEQDIVLCCYKWVYKHTHLECFQYCDLT